MKLRSRQEVLVLVGAVTVITASVLATLLFSGVFSGSKKSQTVEYRNVTFTDAVLSCEEYTQERYQSRINSLTLDDHSSRFDGKSGRFKIFMYAHMAISPHQKQAAEYWVNCFVNGRSGKISDYRVYEDKDAPMRDGKKLFGWP